MRLASAVLWVIALDAVDASAQALVAPVAPETITRDASGERAIVRFVKLPAPLQLDGQLGESLYLDARPISDFILAGVRAGG